MESGSKLINILTSDHDLFRSIALQITVETHQLIQVVKRKPVCNLMCYSVSDIRILGKTEEIRVLPTRLESMTFRLLSLDALRLSYRRLVGV